MQHLQALQRIMSNDPFKCCQEDLEPQTGKVGALIGRLNELVLVDDSTRSSTRCIVFVKEVATTDPLADLLDKHVKPGVRPVSGTGSMSDTVRQKNIDEFKEGSIWCLVSTDSLEEGIDIPDCNIVVRFDRFHNVKSHVQGTGRCRNLGKGGLVLYFENDPDQYEHEAELVDAIAREEAPVGEMPALSPQLDTNSSTDPSTGAEVNGSNCLQIFNTYAICFCIGRFAFVLLFGLQALLSCGCKLSSPEVTKASRGKEQPDQVIASRLLPLMDGGSLRLESEDEKDFESDTWISLAWMCQVSHQTQLCSMMYVCH